jgi:uncharacterized membrane protein YhaH (DUF805 family)
MQHLLSPGRVDEGRQVHGRPPTTISGTLCAQAELFDDSHRSLGETPAGGRTGRQEVSNPYTPYPQSDDQGGYGQQYQSYPPGTPQGYLQGGPVGFGEAISQAFKNIFTFEGRASRSAYWWFALFLFLVSLAVDIVAVASGAKALQYAFSVVVFVLSLGLQVRRLHDTNRSGYWWFIGLIPIVGTIVLLVFNCQAGTPGQNKFG